MAYAVRLFLKMVHDTGQIGRIATKPTQAQEDAVNAGIVRWLLQGTKFQLKRKYAVDAYEEHKENVDAIVALLPKDFKAGMENWSGEIHEHISDTNFGLLLHDMINQRKAIVYATDLDGDRLTDLMADAPDVLRAWGQMVLDHVKAGARHEQGLEGHGLHHDQRQGHDQRHVPHGGRADLRADARLRRRDAAAPARRRRDRRRREAALRSADPLRADQRGLQGGEPGQHRSSRTGSTRNSRPSTRSTAASARATWRATSKLKEAIKPWGAK